MAKTKIVRCKAPKEPDVSLNVYSIRWPRSKTGFNWTPPFLAYNDETALASLITLSKECPDLQGKYVYRIGRFFPTTGVIEPLERRVLVKSHVSAPADKKEDK